MDQILNLGDEEHKWARDWARELLSARVLADPTHGVSLTSQEYTELTRAAASDASEHENGFYVFVAVLVELCRDATWIYATDRLRLLVGPEAQLSPEALNNTLRIVLEGSRLIRGDESTRGG